MHFISFLSILLPSLITFTEASPVKSEGRSLLAERLYNGCIEGYNASEDGICHRILDYNCNKGRCEGPIPKNSHYICNADGACGFECDAKNGFNGTVCNKARKPCDVSACDSHTPPNAKTTCADDRCYFTCYPGFHRVGDTCQKTLYSCNNSPALCPEFRQAFSTTLCRNSLCVVVCNLGYQYSPNGNHCIATPTKCGKGATAQLCSSIANGAVNCDGNNCVYSCNTDAGYTLTGPTTCTLSP